MMKLVFRPIEIKGGFFFFSILWWLNFSKIDIIIFIVQKQIFQIKILNEMNFFLIMTTYIKPI